VKSWPSVSFAAGSQLTSIVPCIEGGAASVGTVTVSGDVESAASAGAPRNELNQPSATSAGVKGPNRITTSSYGEVATMLIRRAEIVN
jgi:hypothetical protein